jgi:hypothetical protein
MVENQKNNNKTTRTQRPMVLSPLTREEALTMPNEKRIRAGIIAQEPRWLEGGRVAQPLARTALGPGQLPEAHRWRDIMQPVIPLRKT